MYLSQIKLLTSSFLSSDFSSMNAQLKWKLLKYEIRKLTIDYAKRKQKKEENNKHI